MSAERSARKASSKVLIAVGILLCIVLIPILVINTTLIVKSFIRPDEVPSFLGYKPFIVLSGSMEPEFYSGDVVIVKEASPDTLNNSDIIAFRSGESVITHRIVEIKDLEAGKKQFITKGDNNNVEDSITVTSEMLEGKYLMRIAKIGNFAMFLQTPVGMIVFVALPLILFVLYDVLRRTLSGKKADKRTMELEAELERMRGELAAKEVESAESKSAEETGKEHYDK